MAKTYPPLPAGSVTCPNCARSGHHVEMERDNLDVSYLKDQPLHQDTGFRSYRCPDCEYVEVFQISR